MSEELHLDEMAIEALAHGRPDVVERELREHVSACAECAAAVEEARVLSEEAGGMLRAATPAVPDLDALIAGALASAAQPVVYEVPRPSRRAVVVAALVGLAATVLLGLASLPSVGAVVSAVKDGYAMVGVVDRIVGSLVPGGWTTVTLVGLALLLLLYAPMRALLRGPERGRAQGSVVALLFPLAALLAVSLAAGHAHAQSGVVFEGDWPARERSVTVSVERAPATEVLRAAAESAGLGLVASLPVDPQVTLHVRNAALRDVVEAVLGDFDVTAERTESMLIVRARGSGVAPAVAAGGELPEPSEPSEPAEPSEPSELAEPSEPSEPSEEPAPAKQPVPPIPPVPPAGPASDRVTFGNAVVVRAGERVRDVVTMGGDVEVYGEVVGEIATMGGDVDVYEGGVVSRGVFTMGGDVTIHDGGAVYGEIGTMGGDISRAEGAHVGGDVGQLRIAAAGDDEDERDEEHDHGSAIGRWLEGALGSAAKHALLFVLGVILLGVFPERISALQRVIVRAPARSGVSGLLGFVGATVLTIVLAVTIVGIPGALIVVLGSFAAVYIGLVAMATVVGAAIPVDFLRNRPILQLGAGILAFYLASLVPVAGTIATVVVAALGFGSVLLTRFRKQAPGDVSQGTVP